MADDEHEIPDWRVRLFLRLGVPTSALVLIGISFYRVAVWTGEHVVSPVVTRQVQALTTMEELLKTTERTSKENQQLIKDISVLLERQGNTLHRIEQRVDVLDRSTHPK